MCVGDVGVGRWWGMRLNGFESENPACEDLDQNPAKDRRAHHSQSNFATRLHFHDGITIQKTIFNHPLQARSGKPIWNDAPESGTEKPTTNPGHELLVTFGEDVYDFFDR